MNSVPTVSLQQLEDSVKEIFKCEQKQADLQLKKSAINAEMALFQHMVRAFKLINKGDSND
jgi:hypothetical protein